MNFINFEIFVVADNLDYSRLDIYYVSNYMIIMAIYLIISALYLLALRGFRVSLIFN